MNPAKDHNPSAATNVLLVTGISGAGKTTTLKALEDMNYEAVDNVPLTLIDALVLGGQRHFDGPGFERPIAIGVDIRTRDFNVESFLARYDGLIAEGGVEARILFIDCTDEVLRRRFEETRHRHPLALDRPVADGIARERVLLADLRDRADLVVDTSEMGPGDLKRVLQGHFPTAADRGLVVFVTSFSFARGLPRDADLVFDVRFLINPHYEPELRDLSGLDHPVAAFVEGDPGFAEFFSGLAGLLSPLLPRYAGEGKSYLTIAVGCTGGRHRSVVVAEKLAKWFESEGQQVQLHHRDLAGAADRSGNRQ